MKQKSKKIFKVILIMILIVIAFMIGSNKLVHTEYNSLNDMDKNMLKQLSEVYETYNNKSQDIWKEGYNFKGIPLVLTPASKDNGMLHTYSYVVGVDKLEDSIFSKKIETPKEMNLPPIYRVSAISPSVSSSWLPFNFTFTDIGKQHAAFFKYTSSNTKTSDADRAFKYTLMHEVFHEYRQVALWKNVNNLRSSIQVDERNKEQYQLFLTEFAILDKANSANDKSELLNILSDFVTVREARYSKFDYMKQEKSVETLEGCAQYVEYKYSTLVGDIYKHPFNTKVQNGKFADRFSKKSLLDTTSKTKLNGFMDKDLYYYVGSSEGILLDKLQINWKDSVENNELVYDILKREVRKQVSGDRKSLEDIKNEYGYNTFGESAQIIANNFK
ncbi:hypothetical protein SAMN02745163_01205 [Clostridium cavendishii DSM 21758]|uniref:Uncharacterized protein n=1 Tax=Clostridium cavendishii DSM 21758 TaxID=1121302 RepID=A0A1M6G760_9CLOT|nr:hypothetical protein [Clostridium cavendishii]SHJ05790.1 hypothetical protein SAMN02745163_01205 [Clostridium cavendishii DSM 21758]